MKMKNRWTRKLFALVFAILLLLPLLLLLAGCGEDSPGGANNDFSPAPSDSDNSLAANRQGKVILTYWVNADTENYEETFEKLNRAVEKAGGYFDSSSVEKQGDFRRAEFSIRIPAEASSSFVENLSSYMVITSSRSASEDVTTAYVDLESRIAALEAEQTALKALYDSAENYSDLIVISERLYQVIAELEGKKSQLLSYSNKIAYSTVTLSLRETDTPEEAGVFSRIGRQFTDNLRGIGDFFVSLFIFFLGNLPVLLLLAAIVPLIVLLIRRSMKKSAQKRERLRAMRPYAGPVPPQSMPQNPPMNYPPYQNGPSVPPDQPPTGPDHKE